MTMTMQMTVAVFAAILAVVHACANSVIQTESESSTLKPDSRLVMSALSAKTNQCQRIVDAHAVAWSMKVSNLAFVPNHFQEAVVQVHWVDRNGGERHTLACRLTSPAVGVGRWGPRRWEPYAYWESPHEPTEKEIVAFIQSTSFGNNEYDREVLVVLIVLYHPSQGILASLEQGISAEEKRRRHDATISQMVRSIGGFRKERITGNDNGSAVLGLGRETQEGAWTPRSWVGDELELLDGGGRQALEAGMEGALGDLSVGKASREPAGLGVGMGSLDKPVNGRGVPPPSK